MDSRDLKYYSSLYGGFWSFDVRDFCYMTNQYFPPDSFIEALSRRLTRLVKSYPSTNWHLSSLAAQPSSTRMATSPSAVTASRRTASSSSIDPDTRSSA